MLANYTGYNTSKTKNQHKPSHSQTTMLLCSIAPIPHVLPTQHFAACSRHPVDVRPMIFIKLQTMPHDRSVLRKNNTQTQPRGLYLPCPNIFAPRDVAYSSLGNLFAFLFLEVLLKKWKPQSQLPCEHVTPVHAAHVSPRDRHFPHAPALCAHLPRPRLARVGAVPHNPCAAPSLAPVPAL